ncbi:unnamed protein product, partial [Timema podura]|nr:unnamed protein product [Timema podura]
MSGRAIVKGNCNLPYSSNEYQNQKHLQQQLHKQQHHNHNHTHLVQQNQQQVHQPSRKIAINNAGYSGLPSRAKLDLVPASTHNLSSLGNLGSMQQTQLNTLLVMHQSRLCQNTNQRAVQGQGSHRNIPYLQQHHQQHYQSISPSLQNSVTNQGNYSSISNTIKSGSLY